MLTPFLSFETRLPPSQIPRNCTLTSLPLTLTIRTILTPLKHDGPEARYQLGLILHNEKNQAAAKEQFEIFEHLKQQTEQETQAAALNSHGNELLKQGLAREAVEAYQKALLLRPKDARLHYNLAFALAKLGDSGREEHQLREALELDPHFAQAHDQLGS